MAELRHKDKTITTRIVYYGPGTSGKTTNIQVLHEHASTGRRGELVSVNTAQDRTIMFDLLPIKVAAFRGLDLKVQLVAVPGQPMYAAIRRLALRDVDALVFVANSAPDHQEENAKSLKELFANLARLPGDTSSLPLVLQYNKRDLPGAVPVDLMDRALNAKKTTAVPAIAIRGEGVLETFSSILTLNVADLTRRYKLADLGRGQTIEDWAAAAVREIFGTTAIMGSAPPTATASEPPGRRTVRLALPPDVSTAERLDARTNEALVESYAQAAAALTEDAQVVREERDLVQRRLSDLLEVLEAAKTLKPGSPRDPVNNVILRCLAREVEAGHASLLVPGPNQSMRTAGLLGLERDPILFRVEPMPRLRSFLQAASPRWHETENDAGLRETLASSQPPQGSVVSVPIAAGLETPIGLALLYRAPGAAPPRRESLKHLADLARILAQFLDSPHAASDTDSGSRETLGTAYHLAAPRLLHCFRDLRQKLADLRRHPDSPTWLTASLAEIAPSLGEAAAIGRSLLGLDTGTLEDESQDAAVLFGRLQGSDVHVAIGPGVKAVRVDPVLFGLALDATIDRARRQIGAGRSVEVLCAVRDGRVSIRIGAKGPVVALKGPDPGLAFPQRVIELHGGHLAVEVEPSQGSWVVLDVPAAS